MGTYLALKARKSDIYTTPNGDACVLVLVVRAALGELHLTKEAMARTTMPADVGRSRRLWRSRQRMSTTAATARSMAYTCPDAASVSFDI